jgi:hypothetical protein
MTQPQTTAEVLWTAYRALGYKEREAFLKKLMKDKRLAEDLRYASIVEKRKSEPTISLDDYLAKRDRKN